MPSEPFKGLKVTSNNSTAANAAASEAASDSSKVISRPEDISSPHELTAFVENVLGQLESKFDDMSTQILDKMTQMSSRVDALETSIQDLINGDLSAPQSPGPMTAGMTRKSTS